jgi:hypothetical protein
MTGRPPVSADIQSAMLLAFADGKRAPAVAAMVGVHRNTALRYYHLFCAGMTLETPLKDDIADAAADVERLETRHAAAAAVAHRLAVQLRAARAKLGALREASETLTQSGDDQ